MKTKIQKQENINSGNFRKTGRFFSVILVMTFFLSMISIEAGAHCDTMDGPLIKDARKAIEQNNVNYVLKWVPVSDEAEVRQAFEQMMKVHGTGWEAKEVSEKNFFETLVRIHRTGEGVPFTGVKPSGTPVDEKIIAADKAIEAGDLSPLRNMVPAGRIDELSERFDKVMALKDFDVNNIEAGREYVEAYVQFFKYAEGEEGCQHHEHN